MRLTRSISLALLTLSVGPANAVNHVQSDGTCPLAIFIPFHDE
jgi:hypothetical protein